MRPTNRNTVLVTDDGRAAYAALLQHSVQWRAYVQNLPGHSPHGPWLVEDLFYAVYEPKVELNPDAPAELHRNFAVIAALLPVAAFQRLRQQTVGNPITAAMAARRLADDLLPDDVDVDVDGNARRSALSRLLSPAIPAGWRRQRRMQRDAVSPAHDGGGCGGPDERRDRRDAHGGKGERRFGAESCRTNDDRDATGGWRRPTYGVMKTLDAVAEAAARDAQVRSVWGIEPGIRGVHALDEVWRLLDAVRALPGFEALTDAFVEMRALMQPAAKGPRRRGRSVRRGFERLDGLTRGRDVERVVPEELVRLLDDDLAGLFHEAYEHGRLLQERYVGKRPAMAGPLVCCLDVSRSMNTTAAQGRERFVWAKGIGLALLDTARRTERPFLGICFSAADDLAEFEVPVGGYRPEIAIDLARCDFDGGTHFRAPLMKAIDYLQRHWRQAEPLRGDLGFRDPARLGRTYRRDPGREQRRETGGSTYGRDFGRGQIVFVTDGEAALPEPFVQQFEQARDVLGFRLLTVFIDGQQPEFVALSDAVFSVRADRIESWEQTTAGLARAIASGR